MPLPGPGPGPGPGPTPPPPPFPPNQTGNPSQVTGGNFTPNLHTSISSPPASVAGESPTHQTGTPIPPILPPPPPPPTIFPPLGPPPLPPPGPPPTITGGPPPTAPSVSSPTDDCQRSVTVIITPPPTAPGSVSVYVNGILRGTSTFSVPSLQVYPAPTSQTVEVPISGCLNVGDVVRATETINGVTSTISSGITVVSHTGTSVLTQHYNSNRTGWNPNETILNTTNVVNLTALFDVRVDGKTYAQPLYLSHVYFPNLGSAHNAIFIATENNSVYAFDADSGEHLWPTSQQVRAGQVRSLNPPGETSVPFYKEEGDNIPNLPPDLTNPGDVDIAPVVGITGTPVISCGCSSSGSSSSGCGCSCSCSSGSSSSSTPQPTTLYVVTKTFRASDNTLHLYLNALDVSTGQDLPNSPVEIKGTVPGTGGSVSSGGNDGNGNAVFNPFDLFNRSALLLLNGTVYVAFAALTDPAIQDPNGWIFSFDAVTLSLKNIFCTAPDLVNDGIGDLNAGIWGSGMGLATDGTYIYCTTADGAFNADIGGTDYGDSAIKLTQDLRVVSWFAAADQYGMNYRDSDFGSSGVLVIPNQQPISPMNLLVTSGKQGVIFLLNRDNLGGYVGTPSNLLTTPNPSQVPPSNTTLATVTSDDAHPPPTDNPNAVYSTHLQNGGDLNGGPAYYADSTGQYLFYCGDSAVISAYLLSNGTLTLVGQSKETFPLGGATVTISSNKQADGAPIVWAINRDELNKGKNQVHQLTLRAYDLKAMIGTPGNPNTVSSLIGDLSVGPWGSTRAFIEPTVVNGKVYVAWDRFPMLSSYESNAVYSYWVRVFGFATGSGGGNNKT